MGTSLPCPIPASVIAFNEAVCTRLRFTLLSVDCGLLLICFETTAMMQRGPASFACCKRSSILTSSHGVVYDIKDLLSHLPLPTVPRRNFLQPSDDVMDGQHWSVFRLPYSLQAASHAARCTLAPEKCLAVLENGLHPMLTGRTHL